MKLTIVLKKQDAIGLGGQILEAMGMHRSIYEPEVFVVQHIQDPRLVAPVDVTESMWPIMYLEALMDEGIKPLRVYQKDNSTMALTPLYASTGGRGLSRTAVADMLDAAANALDGGCGCGEGCECQEGGGTCTCGPEAQPGPDGMCMNCGKPMGAPEGLAAEDVGIENIDNDVAYASTKTTKAMNKAIDALAVIAEMLEAEAEPCECGSSEKDAEGNCAACGKPAEVEVGDDCVKAAAPVFDKKTWKVIREKANDALEKAGFDGNGRFRTVGQANSKLAEVLSNFGIQLADVMSADRFREDSRTQNFNLELVNEDDSFSPVAFDDSTVHYSYTKLSPDRVEVVAYLS